MQTYGSQWGSLAAVGSVQKAILLLQVSGLHLNMQWNQRCFVERLLLIVANSTDAEVARVFNFSFNWMKITICRLVWGGPWFFLQRKSSGHWCVLVAHSTNHSWERAVFINDNLNLVLAFSWFKHQPHFTAFTLREKQCIHLVCSCFCIHSSPLLVRMNNDSYLSVWIW